jgi:hypothetical protein
MTDATQSAIIVGAFALLTQVMARLWSRVEHNEGLLLTRKIEQNINGTHTNLIAENKALHEKVEKALADIAKLETEKRERELNDAKAQSPPGTVAVPISELVVKDTEQK